VKKLIENFVSANVIHILINNSGGPQGGPIINAVEEDFIDTFNRHLICNHILTKAIVPSMKAAGYGRIINIISTSVKVPLPNLGVSNTIRGAVAAWAKTMANELGQYNITVNNVLPGATNTQRLQSIIENNAIKKNTSVEIIEDEMKREIPARRFAEAAEIAAVVAFLASPAAAYVNGTSIPVDGGRTGSI
jgi:3-oxoacyl-[acyl-carrier protein] reductase